MILGREAEFKQWYLQRQAALADANQSDVKKALKRAEKRLLELDKLLEAAFEEKVAGKIPESVCVKRIEKYTAEQTETAREDNLSLYRDLSRYHRSKRRWTNLSAD